MASVVEWPCQVLSAASMRFETPITGFLWMPQIEGFCLVGRVFMDSRGRFQDGRLIRTSTIMEFVEEGDHIVARTFSGSHYVLVQDQNDDLFGLKQ